MDVEGLRKELKAVAIPNDAVAMKAARIALEWA